MDGRKILNGVFIAGAHDPYKACISKVDMVDYSKCAEAVIIQLLQ
jgi:hypothetical protein